MDRSWMYDRLYPKRSGIKKKFMDKVDEFLDFVRVQQIVKDEGGIRCPCVRCGCRRFQPEEVIKDHLYNKGFRDNYFIWTSHGENISTGTTPVPVVSLNHGAGPSRSINYDHQQQQQQEQLQFMDDMVSNALRVNVPFAEPQYDETDGLPNEEAQRFYCLLKELNKPLFDGSPNSKLSMCVRLLGLKSQYHVPELACDLITKMMLDATPINDGLPHSYYQAKQIVSKLGLDVKRIDCCVKGCMLFYSNEFGITDGDLTECRVCGEPRYRQRNSSRSSRSKPIPRKAMFYLPIVSRLQRMFASIQTAEKMTWHFENRRSAGEMRHPSDGQAWKHFDEVHPDFALDPRNVRLGLCSDGFTPYIQSSATPYSCWPVIVTPYNLPPDMCMTKPYMFLSAVIPGPSNPTVGIDIYLQPLIDDLMRLWSGVWTYDIARKQNFMMRAALMWTINDFPAYGMLSGWGTHGKWACPVCMEDTKAFWLKHGGKASWFDCHRRFLPLDHPFRRNKNDFRKGCVETLGPPLKLTSENVWDKVKDVPKVQVVNGVVHKPQGYNQWHNWTKRSIFWDLPYWKDNLLRHNLDVMHIEKNVFDNIFNTVMNVQGKSKDNEKARRDVGELCRRKNMLLVEQANGRVLKPCAKFVLSSAEAKSVYQWIKELKMPDGYCSNLARCADVERGRMQGMKSHDCHIFMECLLPIAFSSLPTCILTPLVELSQYFKNLCSATLRIEDLVKMENDIPMILCKLEKIFPPGFFDSMEHLPVHLANEALLGGPVQYRWMYPFERFMGDSKRSVKNKAKVEGSICSSYLHRETTHFCSHYFKDIVLSSSSSRNEIESDNEIPRHQLALSVFQLPGRPGGREMAIYWATDEVLIAAHVHVLINCTEVQPYYQAFLASYQPDQVHSTFPQWFRTAVHLEEETPMNQHLRKLSMGSTRKFKQWHTYFVNGYKFHTQAWTEGRETINCGVCLKGDTGTGESDFYGVIEFIYELDYGYLDYNKTVVLFYCNWFDPSSRGTKLNPLTNTVDVLVSRRYPLFDPFCIANNVRQVYYVPYPSIKQGWYVAIKTKPRGRIESDDMDTDVAYQVDEMSNVDHVIEIDPLIDLVNNDELEEVNEQTEAEVNDEDNNDQISSSDDDVEWDV